MSTYEPTTFVEPLGYQPVEFLDIPSMSESRATVAPSTRRQTRRGHLVPRVRARVPSRRTVIGRTLPRGGA